jgi:hypothetical protein
MHVEFDRQIKLEFHGSNVPSGGGLLAYPELDNAFESRKRSPETQAHG